MKILALLTPAAGKTPADFGPLILAEEKAAWAAYQAGSYKGRPEDTDRNAGIAAMLAAGRSYSQIQAATKCSRATVAKIAKRAA